MYRKVHILGVQVHNVQFGAIGTRRQGKDWRRARLCSGNERQRELICLSNAHAHANFPRCFHWTTIQVVQCDTSQRMPGHRHMRDPSPLSAICVVGAHSGGEVCVETGGVLHSPMQGTPMRLDVHGGGVVDQRQRYASMVTQFTKAWGALGWNVPVWVRWVVCHSGAHLQRWGNFIKFSSIPTEWRNKSFKMDIRHCFQGWKLSKPSLCHPMGTKACSAPGCP